MVLKGVSQINLLIPSFFCCLFCHCCYFSSASIKPPNPQPNGAGDLRHGPQPPLYHLNTYTGNRNHLHTTLHENRGNPQTLLNGQQNSNTHRNNSHTHINRLLNNSIQNNNSLPHNGIDNPVFTHVNAQNANTVPNMEQQSPNILIQSGPTQGGAQPSAVHVNLNALPQNTHSNDNSQLPTIHVNFNSYSANGPQTQQESSFPLPSASNNNASQTQQNLSHSSNPRMQSGQSYHRDPQLNGLTEAGQPGLIPTGYTHSRDTLQQNAHTQTYQQEPEPHRQSDRNWDRGDTSSSSSHRQMPWDLLRGTPAYPSGTLQRDQTSPDTTDYTTQEERNRSHPQPQHQTSSQSRAPPRDNVLSTERRTRSRSADLLIPNTRTVAQLEAADHTHRSPHTQRQSAQRDIRHLPGSQIAPGQEATHSNNPQARPLTSQQAIVGHSSVSQGPMPQQRLTAAQGADMRALADPNHLSQAHVVQQHRVALIQNPGQAQDTQTQTITNGVRQPRQGGTAPFLSSPAQPNPSNLTQTALKVHSQRTQLFQNREQQTQAALLHPGPQAQTPAAETLHPPTPPPVIPLTQFHTLPQKRTQHKSPARGPQPPRPPVNVPVAQRPQQHPNMQHHHVTMPTNTRHHPGHVPHSPHRHAHAHVQGHRHPAHATLPRQVS